MASFVGCFAILSVFPYFLTLDTFLIPANNLGSSWLLPYAALSLVFSSVSVLFSSLQPHGLQHTRLLCSSSTLKSWSNSCPSGWWCRPTISSSVIPFSSCLHFFPASGSFPMSVLSRLWFFQWSYGCESWTIKKAEHWRIDAFELWCWRRLLRVPWTLTSPF